MMIATMSPGLTRSRTIEPKTEPRVLLQMTRDTDNAKLQPTVFIPSLLQRLVAAVQQNEGQRGQREAR